MRETLNPNSTYAASAFYGSYSYFYERATTGGSVTQPGYRSTAVPCWVEFVRSGNTISSYSSSDGVNWTQVRTSQTIGMGQNVDIGLVSSGSDSSLATATLDSVSVSPAASPAPAITIYLRRREPWGVKLWL